MLRRAHTGHEARAAAFAREFGIPAVIGCEDATEKLRTGDTVTVSFAEGDVGKVYQGSIPFEIQRTDLTDLPRPRTKIMLILGNPEVAFPCSFLPNAGRLLRPASVRRHRNDRRGLLSEAGNRADVGLQDQ